MTNYLVFYAREDGVFAVLSYEGVRRSAERRTEINETTLKRVVRGLVSELLSGLAVQPRSVTVAYTLSRRVEALALTIPDMLSLLSFVDSVTQLPRSEVFFVATTVRAEETPGEILFCGSRETCLFTTEGEYVLPRMKTGGNGFFDYLMSFLCEERDSLEYMLLQTPRLSELFSAYAVYPDAESESRPDETRLFPDPSAYPLLSSRASFSEDEKGKKRLARQRERDTEKGVAEQDPIRYDALTESDRARVDRKYPALYRSVRDRRGNYLSIPITEAADAYREMLLPLKDAPVTALTVVGPYADFPLLSQLLRSFGVQKLMRANESAIVLRGMERLLIDRIADSRLSLTDIGGREIVLWELSADEDAPEKRVSFPVTLRTEISPEEVSVGAPILPYRLERTVLRQGEDGSFRYERVSERGDLRDLCYTEKRDPSGAFEGLRLASFDHEAPQGRFVTALLCIGATPDGVTAHIMRP